MAVEPEGSPNWMGTQARDLKERAPIYTYWTGQERDPFWVWVPYPLLVPKIVHTHPFLLRLSSILLYSSGPAASCLERPITDTLGNLLSLLWPLRGQPTAVKSHIFRENVTAPAEDKEEWGGGV